MRLDAYDLQDAEAEARAAEAARKRVEDIAAGRVRMNGRELYQHEPWVFDDARFDTWIEIVHPFVVYRFSYWTLLTVPQPSFNS